MVRRLIVLLIGRGNSLNSTGLGRGQIQGWVGGWVGDEREGGGLLARCSSSADRDGVHAAGIKGEQGRERGRKGVNRNTKLPTPVAAERGREREG